MKHKHLDVPFEIKALSDEGLFSGYASVFEELDTYRDIVKRGAFVKSLESWQEKGRKVPILWQHSGAQPIGVYDTIVEDEKGLFVEGKLNLDVQQGREAYALLKQGALSGISIGYSVGRDETDAKSGVRRLFEISLYEASLVTFPALDSARVADVKRIEDMQSLSDCEERLRDAGLSKSEALAFVSRIKSIVGRSDSASMAAKTVSDALAILKTTKGITP